MSKLETNTIDTLSGTTNLTIGSTNSSTVTFENGSCTGHNFPAWSAQSNAVQTFSRNSFTKLQLPTENFDTDNAFDNSTNYRFTVPSGKAGKYFVSIQAGIQNSSDYQEVVVQLYKNGSGISPAQARLKTAGYNLDAASAQRIHVAHVIDLAVDDYLEVYIFCNAAGGTPQSNNGQSAFRGYRIGA